MPNTQALWASGRRNWPSLASARTRVSWARSSAGAPAPARWPKKARRSRLRPSRSSAAMVGRVGRWSFTTSLPQNPDVSLSAHPARANP